ncbi:PorV/PorQ family protein [Rhodohalobacter sp. 614A]|uniref:PorV/PorQ family protein n=1 Tax=Rhodohalobacter sp. 614A TaxID=2908649 RepID=UPI001F402758|nr:PorV/PorQ family protein [Rhodohalobacter sp. 614A]
MKRAFLPFIKFLHSFHRSVLARSELIASITLTIVFIFISIPKSYAQDTGSGLDFLNIGPSSRMLSISEATTAANLGPSAIYSNPSLLALENRSSLDASYTLWIANVNNQFAAMNFVRNDRAFAFGVYSSGSNGFEARDRPGPSAGEFSIRYLSLSGAVAQRLGPFSIGVTGQYLREEVFQFRASGYAFNLGLTSTFLDDKIRAAVAVKNLGNMDSLDEESTSLPSSLNVGASASLIQFSTPGENDLPVLLSIIADWSQPIKENPSSDFIENNEDEGYFSLAMDVNIGDLLFVQGGYRWGPTERPFSVGLGLAIESVRVNYALVPFSTGFGTVHSFGVQYYF